MDERIEKKLDEKGETIQQNLQQILCDFPGLIATIADVNAYLPTQPTKEIFIPYGNAAQQN